MLLSANKVYKIKHLNHDLFISDFPRDYIIFSPKYDYNFGYRFSIKDTPEILLDDIQCEFLIDFLGCFVFDASTSIHSDCVFEKLTMKDLEDIRIGIGKKFKYNRKLNKLIKTDET